jgi:outer membrane protein assembly factor BamD (BamD/ComL family)
MLKIIATAAAAAAMLSLAACDGSAEKAGENADSAIEEANQGHENLGDGPLEQAGESIDEATGNRQNNDAADAINDATDGNPNTNP